MTNLDDFKHTHFTRELVADCPGCYPGRLDAWVPCKACLGGGLIRRSVTNPTTGEDFYTCPKCKGRGVVGNLYECLMCGEAKSPRPNGECDGCFISTAFDRAETVEDRRRLVKERRRQEILAEIQIIEKQTRG
jgi:hypothetical protein